ncbi:MAG: 50S ribosomal protein L24 [gamma proteobacterium symbiont of Bathyaustriella thionipta]|nr:50S ribosomal protein L24 [gamma proteobacterium symbiont of Bathyaustriella thionipta]MCU7949052.1 50S ribosomal protein L24 [gamma proteobacterium symbiont of Bathyaustriella thionipta]MCU7952579.1 50S ribosomal protein L24 [gamma proteobacterium symbiont of Bathyaustriella thionipta]MCU7955659.1 50S ribosomal protein L24 [gamma proteobacterium symbiont of Bathyaustriella thionipta]MCU7968128.1 50S ribosomal protein L24 [gamma proteobacterium symbiont of Bathyaustriella thionipta]
MRKLRTGDEVIVIAGKDKGKRGQIDTFVGETKVVIPNVNLAKKHVKANPNAGETGGIVEKAMPLDISNVAIFNAATGKADRVGFKFLEDGKKVRFYKSNSEVIA